VFDANPAFFECLHILNVKDVTLQRKISAGANSAQPGFMEFLEQDVETYLGMPSHGKPRLLPHQEAVVAIFKGARSCQALYLLAGSEQCVVFDPFAGLLLGATRLYEVSVPSRRPSCATR